MEQKSHVIWVYAALFLLALTPLACKTEAPTSPVSQPPGSDPPPSSSGPTDPEVIAFVNLVNTHRESLGLSRLVWDDRVAAVAQAHAQDMVDRNYFSHINPEGQNPGDRLRAAGIVLYYWGENIACNFFTGQAVYDEWMDGSSHQTNIENPRFTHHGVGKVDSMWVHCFVDLTP